MGPSCGTCVGQTWAFHENGAFMKNNKNNATTDLVRPVKLLNLPDRVERRRKPAMRAEEVVFHARRQRQMVEEVLKKRVERIFLFQTEQNAISWTNSMRKRTVKSFQTDAFPYLRTHSS
jgi:hypothetical protein